MFFLLNTLQFHLPILLADMILIDVCDRFQHVLLIFLYFVHRNLILSILLILISCSCLIFHIYILLPTLFDINNNKNTIQNITCNIFLKVAKLYLPNPNGHFFEAKFFYIVKISIPVSVTKTVCSH